MTMDSGARMAQAVACLRALGHELAEVTQELGLASVELEYDSKDGEIRMSGFDEKLRMTMGFTVEDGGADE